MDMADITLSAGDTVVFKGGSIYEFTDGVNDYIEINASGSAGNIITYISGHVHASSWGSGRAKFDCTYAKPRSAGKFGVFSAYRKGYFAIKGIEMYNLQDTANEYSGLIGFNDGNTGNANYITIDDVLFYNFNSTGIYAAGRYVAGTVPTNLTIKNSIMYDSFAHLIMVRYGWDTLLIENNDLDKAGSDPYSAGGPFSNCLVLVTEAENRQDNITVRGNSMGDSVATENKGLFMVAALQNNLIIEDNYFYGRPKLSAIHVVGPGTNGIWRNNVFHVANTKFEGGLRFRSDQSNGSWDGIKIHNNTFVSKSVVKGSGVIYFYGTGTDPDIEYRNVDIRNNIIDADDNTDNYLIYIDNKADGTHQPVVELSTFTSDYNVYQSLKADGKYFYTEDGSDNIALLNFTEWKTWLSSGGVSGADANSTIGQVNFTNEAGDDFTLPYNDTVAKNQGVDLASEGFSDDKLGISRPRGSAWDIGAYEYPNPDPPKNLQIK
jgi:hypothetical protein